jgi:hypothetical protein
MSRDIVIHYDAAERKIVCCTVDATLTAELRAAAFPLETPLEIFTTKTADEAERSLGAAIFALLDAGNEPKIGIRDYKAESYAQTEEWEAQQAQDLELRAATGDSEALFDLAVAKVAHGLRTKSKKLMDEADQLLRKSATAGHEDAIRYLSELWPALKARSDASFS